MILLSREKVWAGAESNRRHEDFQSSALPTELPAHVRTGWPRETRGVPARSGFVLNAPDRVKTTSGLSLALFNLLLGKVNDLGFEADVVEPVDLLHAGRAGHIDLGQVLANDVEADKIQPFAAQARPDEGADLAVTWSDRSLDAGAADMDVTPVFVGARHPQGAA